MKVRRVDGEFVVLDAISGQPMPNQEQFNWLYEAESLAGLHVCIRERKAPGEAMGAKAMGGEANLRFLSRPHSKTSLTRCHLLSLPQVEERNTPKAAVEEPKKMSLTARESPAAKLAQVSRIRQEPSILQ